LSCAMWDDLHPSDKRKSLSVRLVMMCAKVCSLRVALWRGNPTADLATSRRLTAAGDKFN
jgi:hypothetical protein